MSVFKRTLALVLIFMMAAGGRAWAQDGDAGAKLAEQVAKAMPAVPDDSNHQLVFKLELFDAVGTGLLMFEMFGIEALSALGVGLEITGPLAAEAAVLLILGNAHAEAINSVVEDEMRWGFSYGVVLGADDRPESYVNEKYMKHSPVPNTVYPEYGKKFQVAHNRALAAGYAQGKRLLASKTQRAAFFDDLHARMKVHPSVAYGEDQDVWSERTWRDYYIDCAGTFRLHHLK